MIRTTTETALRITLVLDGSGRSHIATGIGFLDHLLTLLAFHAGFDLDCVAGGDLDVDEHHTVEDVLAAFGTAVAAALGSREGVARYGSAIVPMDEARATAAVDLVRRPHAEIALASPATVSAGSRSRCFRTHSSASPWRRAAPSTSRRRAATTTTSPRPRSRRSARRCGRRCSRRRRHPLDQGRRVRVVLADYGAGNLRSVSSAFARAGARRRSRPTPRTVSEAPLAVIAGVGHVESAARGLARERPRRGDPRSRRSRQAGARHLRRHAAPLRGERRGRPRPRPARRPRPAHPGATRVPHMGWNELAARGPSALVDGLDGEDVYFAHSYAVEPADEARRRAAVDHDGRVVAAVEQGALAGVQFHPERSAAAGARLLENALAWSRSA